MPHRGRGRGARGSRGGRCGVAGFAPLPRSEAHSDERGTSGFSVNAIVPEDENSENFTADVQATHSSLRAPRGHNRGVEVPSDPDDRPTCTVTKGCFTNPQVVRAITADIRRFFPGPYITWTAIPNELRELLWAKLEDKYAVEPSQRNKIWQVWNHEANVLYTELLYRARKYALRKSKVTHIKDARASPPTFIRPAWWEELVTQWDTPEWNKRSEAGRRNRLTEKDGSIVKHGCGSIKIETHKERMAKSLNRDPTFMEWFKKVHSLNGNPHEFADKKSKRVFEEYQAALQAKYCDSDEGSSVDMDIDLWVEVVGAPSKGKLYGFGSSFTSSILLEQWPTGAEPQVNQQEQLRVVLQANEKLEQSNERLQQANEKLQQSNDDLRIKNDELHGRISTQEKLTTQMLDKQQSMEAMFVRFFANGGSFMP